MIEVELVNNYSEKATKYEVESISEEIYGSTTYFKFYFGKGKWSKEYSTSDYSYHVIGNGYI